MNPFNVVSMTGSGASIVVLLDVLLPFFGVNLPEGTTAAAVAGAIEFVGWVLLVVGQIRRPDLVLGMIRR